MSETLYPAVPAFGAIVIGDEILSGRRTDRHLPKLIELLSERGLVLAYAHWVGDDPERITALLRAAALTHDVVFVFGGIGATPDDHTRQCAARALDEPMALHPEAKRLITARMVQMAEQQGQAWDPDHPDSIRRLEMGVFPVSAQIIPNPYNQIPGFSCRGQAGAQLHFVPGFPVMAWPMVAHVLDHTCVQWFAPGQRAERSVIVYGAMEASLTPLMERIERTHPQVKVFSLPSVDHPEHGRHIDLGVKGPVSAVSLAFADLRAGLGEAGANLGPEMVRS